MRLTKPREGKLCMQSRFDSRCQACGEKIYEGDEIAKDEDLDAWVHEDCVDNIMPRRSLKPPKKKGTSLADKLEGFEPASVASPALKSVERPGAVVHLVEQLSSVSRGEKHWNVIGVYADPDKALKDAFPSGVSNDNYRVKSWTVRR